MKFAAIVIFSVLGVTSVFSGSVQAQSTDLESEAVSKASATSYALPIGVTLVQLNRYFKPRGTKRLSHLNLPQNWGQLGWRHEGTLGFISTTPFAASHPIYSCFVAGQEDFFTSLDVNCEGHQPFSGGHLVGYVSSVPVEGALPIYRCRIEWRKAHMDSFDPHCYGEVGSNNDGLIGYVF
ncbi:hypothetical protein [Stenotrophomonas sp. MMGLT7]|uniref:hypothetical protein n=1 Tax=Stenotrophomonas sp. MMGLT7 TaxID=2901227 RepID=UPI001E53E5C8|nr:hypothetical protein [Stenotrophomonas sp. MMGLT7]MCD7096926.1 hypothetical protein [Stenotrophomonas sp. MMGLT7]